MDKAKPPALRPKNFWKPDKALLKYGLICGVILFTASNLQQLGIESTTVGKAGFITTFYIVLVPVLGLFFKRRCPPVVWLGMVCAIVGLYLLCIKDGFCMGKGDLLVVLCSLAFSFTSLHRRILTKVDWVRLSCLQFLVSA
jgi:drug/metabolite transporter (DMT)-like permease